MNSDILIVDSAHQGFVESFIKEDSLTMFKELNDVQNDKLIQQVVEKCELYEEKFSDLDMSPISSYFQMLRTKCNNEVDVKVQAELVLLKNYLSSIEFFYV